MTSDQRDLMQRFCRDGYAFLRCQTDLVRAFAGTCEANRRGFESTGQYGFKLAARGDISPIDQPLQKGDKIRKRIGLDCILKLASVRNGVFTSAATSSFKNRNANERWNTVSDSRSPRPINAFGNSALVNNISGNFNTAIGYQAGYDNTLGSNNLVLGNWQTQGVGITTGSDNILLGRGVRAGLSQTTNGQLNIGNLIFGTSLGVDATPSTGKVGIGTSSPTSLLTVAGAGTFAGNLHPISPQQVHFQQQVQRYFPQHLASLVLQHSQVALQPPTSQRTISQWDRVAPPPSPQTETSPPRVSL